MAFDVFLDSLGTFFAIIRLSEPYVFIELQKDFMLMKIWI
jgi:hypothetical protein